MARPPYFHGATAAWHHVLELIFCDGQPVRPRGMTTTEVLHSSVAFRLDRPLVICPARKLSYKFAAAEALWILAGDDSVEGIAPFNKRISDFSDDGKTFFGAYGPKVVGQLDHVVNTLIADRASRQAVMSIWRENPPPTKDVPCTLILAFTIRSGVLQAFATMRSSDAWLGVPYDFFNFSMIALRVAQLVNERALEDAQRTGGTDDGWRSPIRALGYLHWSAFSSHLYERDLERARECWRGGRVSSGPLVPSAAICPSAWPEVISTLEAAREANAPPAWDVLGRRLDDLASEADLDR